MGLRFAHIFTALLPYTTLHQIARHVNGFPVDIATIPTPQNIGLQVNNVKIVYMH